MDNIIKLSRTLPCFKHTDFVEFITVHRGFLINVDVVCIEQSRKTEGLLRKLRKAYEQMQMQVRSTNVFYRFIPFFYDKELTREKIEEFAQPAVLDEINQAEAIIDEYCAKTQQVEEPQDSQP
jgi:hypothetical protein